MDNEWKMVPVEPTDDMIVAFAEAWYSKRQCIDDPDMLDAYRNMLAVAPVPPAGDVEVLNAMFEFPMPPTVESVLRIAADGSRIRISADGSIYPVPPAGNAEESVADVVMFEGGKIIDGTLAYMETAVVGDRLYSTAHVTRLTAERDGLLAEVADLQEIKDYVTQPIRDRIAARNALQSELAKAFEDLRLEKLVSAAMCQQAEDFKALSWERGQELTKAREQIATLSGAGQALLEYAESGWDHFPDVAVNMRAALAHQSAPALRREHILYRDGDSIGCIPESILDRNGQVALDMCTVCGKAEAELNGPCDGDECKSAPAAKDGESGETICLLCFDKKTVPGPKHGDFVRDCPECCGEEG